MAEYSAPGAAGASPAGANINGSGDANFAAAAPMANPGEAAKTLW